MSPSASRVRPHRCARAPLRSLVTLALVLLPVVLALGPASGRASAETDPAGADASRRLSGARDAAPRVTLPRQSFAPLGASAHVAVLGTGWSLAGEARAPERRFELFAPETAGPDRPLVVMLPGACGEALPVCERWRASSAARGWLVCPDGPSTCEHGEPDWHGDPVAEAAYLDAAVAELRGTYGRLGSGEDVLVGFSRGAFAARDIALAQPGRWPKLLLVGAAVRLDPAALRAAGIEAVVLASGELDSAHGSMVGATARLAASGIPARFLGLGPIYHQLPHDFARYVDEALGWLASVRTGA
ncbi:MAG: alpha/beta hydrolase [Myxococcales bacterium]|nr:alpha/beta hydrolase [Myxococcales bacterium]